MTDKCEIYLDVSHKAGCPAGEIIDFAKLMHDYPWLFGIIMVVGGPLVAMYGKRFFPWVVAGIVSVTLLMASLVICSVLGFMSSYSGVGISIGIATLISLLAGYFIKRMVFVAVAVLGVVGGFFLGSMIYTTVLAFLHWNALWAMISFSLICAVLGGYLSFNHSKAVVLVMTSVIGAYAFMRGLSYFVGGFPSEAAIIHSLTHHETIKDMNNMYWIYLTLFFAISIGGMVYQANQEEHEDLKNNERYKDSDDNFAKVVMKIKNAGKD